MIVDNRWVPPQEVRVLNEKTHKKTLSEEQYQIQMICNKYLRWMFQGKIKVSR